MQVTVKERVIERTSAGYFIGFIAAAIYFIQHATGFWMGVLGFLKATVWPGFVVYYLLDYLKVP